ncbi:hypothetical protein ABL78_6193 [Leptomonas seymouri]|uniref:DUF4456 domain-containing protein n=1 Tax=Leptomonas seymouri TaxID=5684 RepID=A0A0N1PC48_LEPSE|nr:hypothetical protein ABL78_6193 [Leptomonas seymouri]|eukprot:KPI84748.1 hypothetical protein ABL78_6193 [Leptomonas seymouri]
MEPTASLSGASASPPTRMYNAADASAAASLGDNKASHRHKGGTLHDRLLARRHETIENFKAAARQYNSEVDEAQQVRIGELHRKIAESHEETAALLSVEQQRLEECVSEWQPYEDAVQRAAPDDILPLYTDRYHSAPDEQGRAKALDLMKQSRMRVVRHFVELRDHYKVRMAAIEGSFHAIEAAEDARRVHIQEAVRDLMASLTRIAVTSTTESQVLAQRILHHTNEQLGQNYLTMQMLATQLRQRELWKHQQYQDTLATVYRSTQQHMANRHITWAMTVLRSDVFRRPEGRLQSVHGAGQLITAIRKEAEELVRGLSEVVTSLQVAQPSAVTAELQVCGGSSTNGWLRSFQPSVQQSDVFAGEDPHAVLGEAQMRASVLLRHCRARCDDFIMRLRAEEEVRAQAASTLAAHVCQDITVIASPLNEEIALLQAASLADEDVSASSTGGVPGEAGGEAAVDAALRPLTQPHAEVLRLLEALPTAGTWSQTVPAIVQEGQWFVQTVSHGLLNGWQLFCVYATTSNSSMLVHLEGATDLLFSFATTLLGTTRTFYAQWREQEKDYQDSIAELERQMHVLEEQLRQDESPAAAAARYAAGIACLQSIADAHMRHYEGVRGRITTAASTVLRVGQDGMRELSAQLGLSLAPLKGEEFSPETSVCFSPTHRNSASLSQRGSMRTSFIMTASTPSRMSTTQLDEEEIDTRPRVTASHGEDFIEVSPNFHFACMVQRGEDGAAGAAGLSTQDEKCKRNGAGEAAGTASGAEPGIPFQKFYLGLLPDLQPGQDPLFLRQSEVRRWNKLLRQVLLDWSLQLQRQTWGNWRLYTTALLADVQRRVMDVLRHHRRRPATLQADIYEARVRELADIKNRGEKLLARIAERVSRVHTLQQAFLTQPTHSAADLALSEERVELIESVRVANSVKAVQAAAHRHDALCAQYNAALADRCSEAMQHLEQARDTIEAECAQILCDRAAELSGGGAVAQLPADDPLQLRVADLRSQAQRTLSESAAAMETLRSSRAAEVQSWREKWATVIEHSSAELDLFQGMQEGLSRLRANVQTLLAASSAEEVALAAGVAQVAEESAKAQSTNTCDLATSLQALLRHDAAVNEAGSSATSLEDLPSVEDMEGAVMHALEAAKMEQRERVRGAPVCSVLAVLDELRVPLYSYGCRLGVLAHAAEMWRMSPPHYLLPQMLGDESLGHRLSRGSSAGGSGGARGSKRAKAALSAQSAAVTASMGHTLMPPPTVTTLMAQVKQWTSELKSSAESAVRQHLEAHPGPLDRRLPGMTEGTEASFLSAVSALCQAQENSVRTYTDKAGPTYRQHIQELWNVLQGTPSLLAATLEAEAAMAALTRVECVLRPWQRFYAKSTQQWQRHRGSAKLSLASQLNSSVLTTLTEAESKRFSVTDHALQRWWSWALRELQDEAGLHVARCWTALYTFLHLLSGLVSPQHLLSTVQVVEGGQHRGLRHLLELRAQRERTAAAMDSLAVARREPRLQETMPLHRADQPGAAGSSKRHASKAAEKASGNTKDPSSASVLTPLPWGEVELPGLPLNGCAPLTQYNSSHPQTAVPPPAAATPYVPSAAASNESKTAQQSSRRQNANYAASGGAGNRKYPSNASDPPAAGAAATPVNTVELSIPLVVPRFPLALECVQLLRNLVCTVVEEDNEAARVITEAFSFWERHEAQLRQTWALTIAELSSEQL